MAIVYTRKPSRPDLGQMTTDIVLDGSYGAGGYAIDLPSIGMLDTPDHVEVNYTHQTATLTLNSAYDYVNNKLKFFKSNTASAPTEAASGDITASASVRVVATGRPRL